jgi:hypothetical protein
MMTLLIEICREFLYQQKRFYDKVIVFDVIAFGAAECVTCLLIMYIFIGINVWNLKLTCLYIREGEGISVVV